MPKRRGRKQHQATSPDKARDLETIRIVNEVLSQSPVRLCLVADTCILPPAASPHGMALTVNALRHRSISRSSGSLQQCGAWSTTSCDGGCGRYCWASATRPVAMSRHIQTLPLAPTATRRSAADLSFS